MTADHEKMIAKRGRGRPPGALNIKTRIKRELFGPQHAADSVVLTPTQVMAANMEFFQAKAEEILADAEDSIKRGVSPAELHRQFEEVCKLKQRANEAACQLAPYVHSKLPVATVQLDEQAAAYVIRVPDAHRDGAAWSRAIDAKTITAEPHQMNGSRRDD